MIPQNHNHLPLVSQESTHHKSQLPPKKRYHFNIQKENNRLRTAPRTLTKKKILTSRKKMKDKVGDIKITTSILSTPRKHHQSSSSRKAEDQDTPQIVLKEAFISPGKKHEIKDILEYSYVN
ncbi:hypothetical protein Tco_1022107, partial [Tanacetum coccineum]